MWIELQNALTSGVLIRLAQAAGATVLCLAVVMLCRFFAVHVERDL